MNTWIKLGLGVVIIIVLFITSTRLGIKTKLVNFFYRLFKNTSAKVLHVLAFVINFVVLMAIGLSSEYISNTWFDVIAFPILIVLLLTVTTSIITVAKIKQTPFPKTKNKAKK